MPKLFKLTGKLFLILILLSGMLQAEEGKKQDVWEPFRFFVGTWKGTVDGKYGKAEIEQEFQFVLGGEFLQVRNNTVFEPTEKNPEGELHQDWGFFSYDHNREKFVFRQFHLEGFVNQYVLDSLSADGKTLTFTTESIENIAVGWRARLTYNILNPDQFNQIFELAPPDKDFEVCTQGHLQRQP